MACSVLDYFTTLTLMLFALVLTSMYVTIRGMSARERARVREWEDEGL